MIKLNYDIVNLSDSEYYDLFNDSDKYSFVVDLESIPNHEVYSLKIDKLNIVNLVIEYVSDSIIFIVGFQRNKRYPEYKGYGSILLNYIINKFNDKSILLFVESIPELENYYKGNGFKVCNKESKDKLIKSYNIFDSYNLTLMIYDK